MTKMLCLLNDGSDASSAAWTEALSRHCQLEVIDLAKEQVPYDTLVDKIFASDKVMSW
jgi:hypothetical protein